jgi:cyclic pyranopterin phosphate synthase
LFASNGHDLREPLRGGASDAELGEKVRQIWAARADRYSELRALPSDHKGRFLRVEMSHIGG